MRETALLVIVCIALMAVCTTGCTDKKTEPADTVSADTVVEDTTPVDTMEELISENPMPKAAEELFNDFIFNFAANKQLQRNRITFPLPVKNGEITTTIMKEDWEMERFFMQQGYYTLLLDSRRQLDMANDTSVKNVVIEKLDLVNDVVKRYNFDRENGQWRMTALEYTSAEDNVNAGFLRFYQQFATDSTFRAGSLNDPIRFTGPDPEDDFNDISTDISPAEWESLGLDDLPNGLIYNIIYGQEYKRQDQKIFLMRGIANGLEVELTFSRIEGSWRLTKVVE